MTKMGELYTGFAKEVMKPVEAAIAVAKASKAGFLIDPDLSFGICINRARPPWPGFFFWWSPV